MHFPLLPIRSSKPFNCLLQSPFRNQDAASLSPPLTHCTVTGPRIVKDPLSAGPVQALEIREGTLSYRYSHDLVILSHEYDTVGVILYKLS